MGRRNSVLLFEWHFASPGDSTISVPSRTGVTKRKCAKRHFTLWQPLFRRPTVDLTRTPPYTPHTTIDSPGRNTRSHPVPSFRAPSRTRLTATRQYGYATVAARLRACAAVHPRAGPLHQTPGTMLTTALHSSQKAAAEDVPGGFPGRPKYAAVPPEFGGGRLTKLQLSARGPMRWTRCLSEVSALSNAPPS